MTVIPETRAASAVVLPLLFEEQLVLEKQARFAHLEAHKEGFAEALSFLPAVDDFDKSSGEYLRLIQDAKRAVSIPIIASLNGIWPGGWVTHARMLRRTITISPPIPTRPATTWSGARWKWCARTPVPQPAA